MWMNQFLDWKKTERGDLEITLTGEARDELIQQLAWISDPPPDSKWNKYGRLEVYDKSEWPIIRRIDVPGLLSLEAEYLEPLVSNSEYQWVAPEAIGAMTDAPIIGIVDTDNLGDVTEVYELYWYPNYAIRSFLHDLARTGKCIFEGGT